MLLGFPLSCAQTLPEDGEVGGTGGGPGSGGTGGSTPEPPECNSEQKLCRNACLTLTDPRTGCGTASCSPCALPHAVATCSEAGECAIDTCDEWYADCDGQPANGCETALDTPTDCGGCGISCLGANVTTGVCAAATCARPEGAEPCRLCRIDECAPGFYNADEGTPNGCESTSPCPAEPPYPLQSCERLGGNTQGAVCFYEAAGICATCSGVSWDTDGVTDCWEKGEDCPYWDTYYHPFDVGCRAEEEGKRCVYSWQGEKKGCKTCRDGTWLRQAGMDC